MLHVAPASGRSSSIAILVALVLLGTSIAGCRSGEPTGLRLEWETWSSEKFLEQQSNRMAERTLEEGEEIWWADDDEFVVCSRGVLPDGTIGRRTTWVLPDQGFVYEVDVWEEIAHGIPLTQWTEARRRISRSRFVAAYPDLLAESSFDTRRRYGGTFSEKREGDRVWVAAVPGRAWRVTTGGPDVPWRWPELIAGFHGVSPRHDVRVGQILARLRPEIIEAFDLPEAQSTSVLTRRLRSAKTVPLDDDIREFLALAKREVDAFESGWKHPEELWHLMMAPEDRPFELELRDVRHRLEPHVTSDSVMRVIKAVDICERMDEYEECYHLLFRANPEEVAVEYAHAFEAQRMDRVVAILSVYSLRSPEEYLARVDEVLEALPHVSTLQGSKRRELRQWLSAVRLWVQIEAGGVIEVEPKRTATELTGPDPETASGEVEGASVEPASLKPEAENPPKEDQAPPPADDGSEPDSRG